MKESIFVDHARLLNQKADIEADLSKVNKKLAKTEGQVLEKLSELGVDSVKVGAEKRTLYLRKVISARLVGDREAAKTGLRAAGLDDLLREDFNLQTVSSHFREELGEHYDDVSSVLPAELAGLLEIQEVFRIGHRSSI